MYNVQSFEEAFLDLGGEYVPRDHRDGTSANMLSMSVDRLQAMIKTLSGMRKVLERSGNIADPSTILPEPVIELGHINSVYFNGYCDSNLEFTKYYLGVTVSVPYTMVEFSSLYFNRPDFMVDVGDPTYVKDGSANQYFRSQIIDKEYYPSEFTKMAALNRDDRKFDAGMLEALTGAMLPDDPVRRGLSLYIAHHLTSFVWIHELAHAVHAHLPKLSGSSSKFKRFRLCEVSPVDLSDIDEIEYRQGSMLSQLCEIDADARAARVIVTQILLGDDPLYGPLNHIQDVNLEDRLTLVLFFLFSFQMMQWFEQKEFGSDRSPNQETHPPSLIRAACTMAQVMPLSAHNPIVQQAVFNALRMLLEERARGGWCDVFLDANLLLNKQLIATAEQWVQHVDRYVRGKMAYYDLNWLEFRLDKSLNSTVR